MSPAVSALLRQRVAVAALFLSSGVLVATWAVHVPSVKQATGASNSGIGAVLLMLGAGAIIGMQVSGYLIDRRGSAPVALLGAVGMAAAILPPLTSSSFAIVTAGALALGVATGAADVGMNAAAVQVERRYGRPIMASFHAVFSIGTVIGAAAGAAGFALGAGRAGAGPLSATLASVVMGLGLIGTATRLLGRHPLGDRPVGDLASSRKGLPHNPGHRGRVTALALSAFLLMLAEGAAMDWSSLHARQHLQATPWHGSLALGCFVAAMTAGRLTVDRIVTAVGPVAVLRAGSLLAAAGFAVVMASGSVTLTLAGWAAAGLGLAGGIPQVFTAAGNLDSRSGTPLSRVAGSGYVAMLAGPAALGWLADWWSLNVALVVPLAAALVCAGMAAAVR